MIDKLRFKFIKITCASVFAVLLVIVSAVNIFNILENNKNADGITQMIAENGGVLKKTVPPHGEFPDERRSPFDRFDNRLQNREELPFSARYFTIYTDSEGNITDCNSDNIASVTDEEARQIGERILSEGRSVGWYKNYRYRLSEHNGGYLLVILEATATKNAVNAVFFITAIVGICAFLIVLLLVWLFSKRAVAPIAEAYDKQKQFITDAGHELKTPLTVISANAEILSLTYGENEWCEGIERQAQSMRNLISQMIQMSKLDENGQSFVFENFSLGDAVYDTAMSFVPVAEKNGLKITVTAEPDLYIQGDEGAIRQVISILTDNAVKYCDAGGFVSVTAERLKNRITVSVKNSYEAVQELDTERIFERFYRGDRSRTASNSYGLGLSISRSVIEKHRASLTAHKGNGCVEMRIQF